MPERYASVLAQQLPEASTAHRRELATLLGEDDIRPARRTLQALLNDGCDPHSLHAALLYGRDALLRQHGTERHDRHTLLYYDRLIAILMQLSMQQLQSRLEHAQTTLAHEGQKLLLTRARNRWLKSGVIELYNYFMEVPIVARVALLESRDDGISIARTEDAIWTITAGEYGRFVLTRIPDSPLCLRMEVQGAAGHKIHLRDAGIMQIARERRCHIRVQCDKAIPVRITHTRSGETNGLVQDYSEAGFGITIKPRSDLREGDRIHLFMNMHGMEIDADARVCWVRHTEDQTRLGLDPEIEAEPHIRQHLQRQVAMARRSVMSRLRMQGLPECLLAL